MFNLQSVEAELCGTQFAGKLVHFPVVESTSTLALDAAQSGAREGVWVADQQMAGRGRGGHSWHSAAGDGLYVSALVTPQLPLSKALWLSLATGLAAREAITSVASVPVDIRWPNDLLIHEKKCGGILVETSIHSAEGSNEATLRHAVIGIGINVNHAAFPPELAEQATSLHIEIGSAPSREVLLATLLRALDQQLNLLLDEHNDRLSGPELLERFTAASSWIHGKEVSVGEDGGYTGVTAGLDVRGFLQVRDDRGALRTVRSGGVRPR